MFQDASAGVGGKRPAAMIAAESDEMTLPAVVQTCESPWHEDNLALLAGLSL